MNIWSRIESVFHFFGQILTRDPKDCPLIPLGPFDLEQTGRKLLFINEQSRIVISLFFAIFFPNASSFAAEIHRDAASQKVLICGVCKDVSFSVENTIQSIERLGAQFNDYQVIIYENNSTDNTAQLFSDWALKNEKVIFISEFLSQQELIKSVGFSNPAREELIARARNIVLQEAMKPVYDDYSYLVMADLDFTIPWNVNEIVNSVAVDEEWDCICANGIDPNGVMYDRYAYRDHLFPIGPELQGWRLWWETEVLQYLLRFDPSVDGLIPVYSAFGGLAIYKRNAIRNCYYSAKPTKDLEIYLKKSIMQSPGDAVGVQNYFNSAGFRQISTKNKKIPIVWKNLIGYTRPICCEHLTFHAAMALRGYKKIFMRPKLTMEYTCTYY